MGATRGSVIKLNGSVGRLATALSEVVIEAVTPIKEQMHADMEKLEKRLDGKIESSTDTTNKNMQAQFAQLRKERASLSSR